MCCTANMRSSTALGSTTLRRKIAHLAIGIVAVVLASTVLLGAATVDAVTTPGAAYADFATPTGANPSWTTSLTVPGAAGFPGASITTNSLSPSVPTGASTWLSTSTPFGAQFASSQNQKYLNFSPTTGQAMSTTVITFSAPTPTSGWGFALGDVDAESIGVTATDVNGQPVPTANLGFQSSFNLCNIPSPKPSTCTGVTTYDMPNWVPGSNGGSLQGNTTDTVGASGWFMPTTGLRTLTLTSTNLSGIPSASLWIASNLRTIAGNISVDPAPPSAPPLPVPGADVAVIDSTGNPVATTTTDANGDFSLPGIAPGIYTLIETAPPGSVSPAPILVDVTSGDVTGLRITNTPDGIGPAFTG